MQVEMTSSVGIGGAWSDPERGPVPEMFYLAVMTASDDNFAVDPIMAVQLAMAALENRLGVRDTARLIVTPEERDVLYRAIRLRLGVEAMRFKPQSDFPRQYLGVHEILVRMA
jgi:hypothetical protein